MKAKQIAIPAIALFLICLVASALLALTNSVTAAKIEEQAALAIQNSLQEVVTEVDGVKVSGFSDETAIEGSELTYFEAKNDGDKTIAYVLTSSAKGYGGDVKVMTAYDMDGVIIGFTVVDCADETPGLGQNAKTHFVGLLDGKSGELTVNKNSNEGNNVQAITAATITSKAVVSAVNASTEAVAQLIGSGNINTEGGESNG